MIAEHRARLPRDTNSQKQSPSVPSEGPIYATSSLQTQVQGPFTSASQRSETTGAGAYFPSSTGLGPDGINIGDYSHLTYGSELEEPTEDGSKKKKVTLLIIGLPDPPSRGLTF